MIKWLRRNIGVIVSSVGMLLLVVVTFGDMGELFTEKYWRSVGGNITSIGAVTLGLVLIQYSIKQGVSEQALSTGLNQPRTVEKVSGAPGYCGEMQTADNVHAVFSRR